MNIEKKYQITKFLSIILSIIMLISIVVVGTYLGNGKEEKKSAELVHGTYLSSDTFLNFSLDEEKSFYYLSGKDITHGKFEKVGNQVYKLLSGKLKGTYVVKDTGGNIVLIDDDSVLSFKKLNNQITSAKE